MRRLAHKARFTHNSSLFAITSYLWRAESHLSRRAHCKALTFFLFIYLFLKQKRSVAAASQDRAVRVAAERALDVCAIAVALVMAGSGNLDTFRMLRYAVTAISRTTFL